jgi:DNA-binding CsgD family transcriptional regulator
MIDHARLMAACGKINDAALLGEGWPEALEALSRAAGARGVMIMHNRDRKLVSFVSDANIREPVEAYLAGKAPPNARQTKVRHDTDPGFRVDFDDFQSSDIARDPFYQDYLRPIGMQWHANARLQMDGSDEIAISFKRELRHGSYDTNDKKMLDHILPHLRASAYVAERVFDAEVRGVVRTLHQRDRPVLEFDSWARVRRSHGNFDGSVGPLTVRGKRVVVAEPKAQTEFDQAIEKAVRPPRRQTLVPLRDLSGQRWLLQIVPVLGRARDVFFATSAVGVVIGRPTLHTPAADMELAVELFRLTVREAQIVALMCEGRSTAEISARLSIVPETVRFHCKAIFEKTGVRGRIEVVAMIARLAS